MQNKNIDKKTKRVNFLIYLFILMFSLFFVLWISRMAYKNTAIDLSEQYIKIQTEDVVSVIETSIRYGKELTNYYGIEDEMQKIVDIRPNTIGVLLLDTEGNPFKDLFLDEESGRLMLKAALTTYKNGKLEGNDSISFRTGDVSGQAFAVFDAKDKVCGYLFVMYDRDNLIEPRYINNELAPLLAVLAVAIIILILLIHFVPDKKKLPILIIMIALFAYMAILYLSFRISFTDLISRNVDLTQQYVQSTVDGLRRKGLSVERIEGMKEYFSTVAEANEAVKSIDIKEGVVKAEIDVEAVVNGDYLKEKLKHLLLSFGAIFIICLMIAFELTYALPVILEKINKRREGPAAPRVEGSMSGTIRLLSFLMYTAIYTSMPYAAVIVRNEGMSLFNLSTGTTSSLPLTLELVMILLVSLLVQRLYTKEKIFNLFLVSLSVLAVGNFACQRVSSALLLILLRAFCGIGFAFLKYFLNTLVALGSKTDEDIKENFANLNAGLLGGITVGSSLGSILAGSFGYFANYIFTAALVVVIFIFGFLVIPWKEMEEGRDTSDTEKELPSLAMIFKNKRLRKAMILTDIPLNIGLMYVVAFLPVYMGVIGQPAIATSYAYIINGLAGVYVGVYMIKLLKKLSVKKSVAISIFMGAAGILILLFGKNAFIVILSAAILGLFDGYGTPTLTGYFTGEGNKEKADSASLLTLYGSIGSAVQIVCPLLYGLLARDDGNLTPLTIFGICFAAFGVLFILLAGKENEKPKEA